jgi:hypothetical protein
VTLTERERFLRYMDFQPVDRPPLMEMGFWTETFERWHHEGLPRWVTHERHRQQVHHRTISQYIRFPVETGADYEALTPRLNGAHPGRYAEDFDEDLLARALATGALDFVQIWEDMAACARRRIKTASLISPRLVREYMLPAYEELVAYLRAGGVKLIMVDCDGRIDELLPIWLEAEIDA